MSRASGKSSNEKVSLHTWEDKQESVKFRIYFSHLFDILTNRLVLKLMSNREIRKNETAVKVQGNQIRFIFNKYNSGRQINFALEDLFDSLEPKIISKNFKSNFVTFTFKKKQAQKWPDLFYKHQRPKPKTRYGQKSEEFETKKDYLKSLKKFNSTGRSGNNRYMFAENENFDKYALMVEDRIMEEGDEGSVSSNRKNSHRMLPSTKEISNKVDDILNGMGGDKAKAGDTTKMTNNLNTDTESFLQNENMVLKIYGKKKHNRKLYGKNRKDMKRQYTPETLKKGNMKSKSENKRGAKLYQNRTPKGSKMGYKNKYMQKSQERRDKLNRLKKGRSANTKRKEYVTKIQRMEKKGPSRGVSDRYASNQEAKKNYFNSWLNNTVDTEPKEGESPKHENIVKKGFKKTINEELMTIDEIIALEKKEAEQNSKLRRATKIREKKTKLAQKKSRSRQKNVLDLEMIVHEESSSKFPSQQGSRRNNAVYIKKKKKKNRDIEIDYEKYRNEVKKGTLFHKGTKSGSSMHRNKPNLPLATFTTREGEFNKIFDLHKQKEITSKQSPLDETYHKEKSHHELAQLKMSRKSVKNIERLSNGLNEVESLKDLVKESFVENFPSNKDNQVLFGSRMISKNNSEVDEMDVKSNLVSIRSNAPTPKNVMFEKPKSKSNINLNGVEVSPMERSRSRPIPKGKGFYDKKPKKTNLRSKSTIQKGPKSAMSKTNRGLSQNLSNLAAHTVVSYEGPNVSVVSQKLREKRGEILDTFAQLNLDMAWVHRQCRYIDLHSTQGVLKFFELQNRLIVKLATKLRKEKNSRFKVEKQCEKMMDNLKKDLRDK